MKCNAKLHSIANFISTQSKIEIATELYERPSFEILLTYDIEVDFLKV